MDEMEGLSSKPKSPKIFVADLPEIGMSLPAIARRAIWCKRLHGFQGPRLAAADDLTGRTVRMRLLRHSCLSICAALAVAGALSAPVWAGGSSFGDDDDEADEGPAYFGFVRDTAGNSIPDAKVTVGIKNRGGVVTRSDALGTYRVPGFGKDVDTKDVDVNCEKEGYKQVKTNRRSAPADAPIVETECTLQ